MSDCRAHCGQATGKKKIKERFFVVFNDMIIKVTPPPQAAPQEFGAPFTRLQKSYAGFVSRKIRCQDIMIISCPTQWAMSSECVYEQAKGKGKSEKEGKGDSRCGCHFTLSCVAKRINGCRAVCGVRCCCELDEGTG